MDWFKLQIERGKLKEHEDFSNVVANVVREVLEEIPLEQEKFSEEYRRLEDRIGYYERAEKQLGQKRRSTDK